MYRTGSAITSDWVKCTGCDRLLYVKRLVHEMYVCRECGWHVRMTARQRIELLADPGSFAELCEDLTAVDPLGFADRWPYADRLAEASERTGEREAVVCGVGDIEGNPVVIAAMEFGFMGGSMGTVVGEMITRAAEVAGESRIPLIAVCASGGARMQEGVLSLLQMAKTSQAIAQLHEAAVPSICVLTDPTYGGVSASFAALGGIVMAETGAMAGFAGPRVIAQTIRQEVPPGFQTSRFLLDHGLVDRIVARAELRPLLARLVALHRPAPGLGGAEQPPALPLDARTRDPWEVVQAARHSGRPTALDYLHRSFEDFVELHGDRCYGDDPAIVAGLARIGGRTVVVVGHQKGHSTKELVARNFGMPHPEGYRKALRMLEYAERHRFPVVTLIDTAGAFPGVKAEERGQSGAIAQAIMHSGRLRVPVVSVVIGEGGSGGALALATGDRLLIQENGFYSVISPEGCAAILWRSPAAAPAAARALRITAQDLLALGVADAIVPEPPGGAHTDPPAAAEHLRRAVLDALNELAGADSATLVAARHARFRNIGAPRPALTRPRTA